MEGSNIIYQACARVVDGTKAVGFLFLGVNNLYYYYTDEQILSIIYSTDLYYSGGRFHINGGNSISKLKRLSIQQVDNLLKEQERVHLYSSLRTPVYYNDDLRDLIDFETKGLNERYIVNTVYGLIKSDTKKIIALYGLRRTGKTVAMLQVAKKLFRGNKIAYILLNSNFTIDDLTCDLQILKTLGYTYVFLDEVSLVRGFADGCNILSDLYCMTGMHIIVASTDSLGLKVASSSILYDRIKLVHTTYIGFKEYSYLFNTCDILEYIHSGGIADREGFKNLIIAKDYVSTSISDNIINSLVAIDDWKRYGNLYDLIEDGVLKKAIEQAVEYANQELTIKLIARKYKDHTLRRSLHNIKKNNNVDIRNSINIEDIQQEICDILRIKYESIEGITESELNTIKEYLSALDVFTEYESGVNTKVNRFLFTQPGLRWYQCTVLLDVLKSNELVTSLSVEEQKILRNNIEECVEGGLIEHTILSACLRLARERGNIQVTQYTTINGEIDMLIYDLKTIDMYEIKRSEQIVAGQYKHLINKELQQEIERKVGKKAKVRRRVVLYRGKDETLDIGGISVEYRNIEKYLINLTINNMF